jgi:hypothetical protein
MSQDYSPGKFLKELTLKEILIVSTISLGISGAEFFYERAEFNDAMARYNNRELQQEPQITNYGLIGRLSRSDDFEK